MDLMDLHTHTTASDGALSPSELVSYAALHNVGVLAVTDHDTTAGLAEAMAAAQKAGIRLICGVELSATHERELHILGYDIRPEAPAFAAAMEELRAYRAERNYNMIRALRDQGLDINDDDVLKYKPGCAMDTIGRVHMARALVDKGYCDTIKAAFDNYVSGDSPAYVKRQLFDAKTCIALIHDAGGKAFLAHAYHSETEQDKLFALIDELRTYGLDGIECYHSDHTKQQTQTLLDYANQHHLLISGGSDFHGENKPHVKMATMPYGLELKSANFRK